MSGHAMDLADKDVTAIFNGISIGFQLPEVIEGRLSFDKAMDNYRGWMNINVRFRAASRFLAIFRVDLRDCRPVARSSTCPPSSLPPSLSCAYVWLRAYLHPTTLPPCCFHPSIRDM